MYGRYIRNSDVKAGHLDVADAVWIYESCRTVTLKRHFFSTSIFWWVLNFVPAPATFHDFSSVMISFLCQWPRLFLKPATSIASWDIKAHLSPRARKFFIHLLKNQIRELGRTLNNGIHLCKKHPCICLNFDLPTRINVQDSLKMYKYHAGRFGGMFLQVLSRKLCRFQIEIVIAHGIVCVRVSRIMRLTYRAIKTLAV